MASDWPEYGTITVGPEADDTFTRLYQELTGFCVKVWNGEGESHDCMITGIDQIRLWDEETGDAIGEPFDFEIWAVYVY